MIENNHLNASKRDIDTKLITSRKLFVQWIVSSGPVRKGQLIGTCFDTPPPVISSSKDDASTETCSKSQFIRARKIQQRKPALVAASSGNNSKVMPSVTSSKSSSAVGFEGQPNASSSFLSKYIQSATSKENSSSVSLLQDKNDREQGSKKYASELSHAVDSLNHIRAEMDGIIHVYPASQIIKIENSDSQTRYIVGKIDTCAHPVIIDNLCVVCGQSTLESMRPFIGNVNSNDDKYNGQNKTIQRDALTLTGGVTVSISNEYGQTFSLDSAQALRSSKKLNLVLDLDHTLLHATADPRAKQWLSTTDDLRTVYLPSMEGGALQQSWIHTTQPHYVKLRPHLAEFILSVMDSYEVSIYTAGTRTYAEKIADVISRHVAHYIRFKGNQKDDVGYMDEMEIDVLRRKVDELRNQVSWFKSKKERQGNVNKNLESSEIDIGSDDEHQTKRRKTVTFKDNEDDPSSSFLEQEKLLKLVEEREEEAQSIRKKVFGSRIISRTDVGDLGLNVKSLKRAFPCGGMMAAIVDDREDVWANAEDNMTGRKGEPPDNLLFIRPYHWVPFLKYADVNNAAGEDITLLANGNNCQISLDESGEHHLEWTAAILKRIHSSYYDSNLSEEERDQLSVPSILRNIRHSVFSNKSKPTKILLSGLVPIEQQLRQSNDTSQPRNPVIRYAEELGAKVVSDVTSDLTYVIAPRDGTDKILRARKVPGCAILSVAFLMDCYWSCIKLNVNNYLLGAPPRQVIDSIATKKSILLNGSDSSEEDDEDFVNEFEKEMEEETTLY